MILLLLKINKSGLKNLTYFKTQINWIETDTKRYVGHSALLVKS